MPLQIQPSSTNDPIIIISDDKDFEGPVKNDKNLSVLKSVEDLFKMLGLEVKVPNIEDFLDEQQDNMTSLFDAKLQDWRLEALDIEDAEIEVSGVDHVELGDITSFGTIGGGSNIIVVGNAAVEANISYTHPDWDTAIYDSEDGTLTPWDDDVSGETEVEPGCGVLDVDSGQ